MFGDRGQDFRNFQPSTLAQPAELTNPEVDNPIEREGTLLDAGASTSGITGENRNVSALQDDSDFENVAWGWQDTSFNNKSAESTDVNTSNDKRWDGSSIYDQPDKYWKNGTQTNNFMDKYQGYYLNADLKPSYNYSSEDAQNKTGASKRHVLSQWAHSNSKHPTSSQNNSTNRHNTDDVENITWNLSQGGKGNSGNKMSTYADHDGDYDDQNIYDNQVRERNYSGRPLNIHGGYVDNQEHYFKQRGVMNPSIDRNFQSAGNRSSTFGRGYKLRQKNVKEMSIGRDYNPRENGNAEWYQPEQVQGANEHYQNENSNQMWTPPDFQGPAPTPNSSPTKRWGEYGSFENLASAWRGKSTDTTTFDSNNITWPDLQQASGARRKMRFNIGNNDVPPRPDNVPQTYDRQNSVFTPRMNRLAANLGQCSSNGMLNVHATSFYPDERVLLKTPADFEIHENVQQNPSFANTNVYLVPPSRYGLEMNVSRTIESFKHD